MPFVSDVTIWVVAVDENVRAVGVETAEIRPGRRACGIDADVIAGDGPAVGTISIRAASAAAEPQALIRIEIAQSETFDDRFASRDDPQSTVRQTPVDGNLRPEGIRIAGECLLAQTFDADTVRGDRGQRFYWRDREPSFGRYWRRNL